MMQCKMVLGLFQNQFVHDIIDYPTFIYPIESGKCRKKEKKLQQFEYLKKKKLLHEIKKFFIVFEGLSLMKKYAIVDKIFNKASSLAKIFEGLLTGKLMF